jgi:L-Ala-D/L-Glu epimerase
MSSWPPGYTAQILELPLRHAWTLSRNTSASKRNVLLRWKVDGLEAFGEAAPNVRYGESAETVLAALDSLLPSLREGVEAFHQRSLALEPLLPLNRAAKAAVDLALHDLAGKRLGAPLYRMLGLDPTRMPPTSYSIGIDTPEVMAAKVREASGFSLFKIKLGSPDDRALIRAVRAVTDKPLRVDANEGWKSKEEALEQIAWLADQNVELVEQPLPSDDLEGARWLKARSPLPLVADEAMAMAADIPRLAEGFHGVNVKLQKCGGIAEGLRAISTARAHGLKIMLGCMIETGLGIAAAAQLAPLVDWVDLDGNLLLKTDPFDGHPVKDGRIVLRDLPGLGVAARAS